MKALIVGHGYVGTKLARVMLDHPGFTESYVVTRSSFDLNRAMDIVKPDVIFNCAGYTGSPNVDACESERDRTIQSNIVLAQNLTNVCASRSIKFVHISSGCVYNGLEKEYSEEDEPNFWGSFYSMTKLVAERLIVACPKHYCMRIRMPFNGDVDPKNLLYKLANYPRLVNFTNSMSHIDDSIDAILHLVYNQTPYGIYNITNPGRATTLEIASAMKLKPEWVSREEFRMMVKAPRSECTLNTHKLESFYKMRPLYDALRKSIKQYRS